MSARAPSSSSTGDGTSAAAYNGLHLGVHLLEGSPQYKWLLVLTLFFVSTLNYADRTAITTLYTLLKTDLGFTDVGLGELGSMFLWSYA